MKLILIGFVLVFMILVFALNHAQEGNTRYMQGFMDGIQARIDYERGVK